MKLVIFCIVFLMLFSACSVTEQAGDKVIKDIFVFGDDTVITIDRGPCSGQCPAYRLSINADGSVKFEGREHTIGKAEDKISPSEVKRLIEQANSIGFLQLEDSYNAANCPSYATDSSTVNITITSSGRSKTISHYLGCSDPNGGIGSFPPGLSDLSDGIAKTADVSRWFKFTRK